MIKVAQKPDQTLIIKGGNTAVVKSKTAFASIKVIQTVSPVPVSGQTIDYIDGGNF